MKNIQENKQDDRKFCIIPPVILKEMGNTKLKLYRVKTNGTDAYQLEMNEDTLFIFSEWQYHVLNALFSFGGDSYDTLLANTNERFGLNLVQNDIDLLFDKISKKKLFDKENAPKHPLTKDFYNGKIQKVIAVKNSNEVITKNSSKNKVKLYDKFKAHLKDMFKVQEKWAEEPKNDNVSDDQQDNEQKGYGIKDIDLFNPTKLFNKYKDAILFGKYLMYPLPLFLFASLFVIGSNPEMVHYDIMGIFESFGILGHIFFGMFTTSALVTFVTAAVAYSFGATVKSISVKWFFGFIPRFIPKMIDTEKFNRNQKLWLHASPLIARLGVFCLGVFLWYNTRHFEGAITNFGSVLAFTALVSFFVASCPFYKSNGYGFLTEFFNEPHLWGKSINALMNKVNKNVYSNSNNRVLVAYSMICVLFVVTLVLGVFTLVNNWLDKEMGPKSYFVIAVLFAIYLTKLVAQLKEINDRYHSNLQFERWRDRTFLTEAEAEKPEPKEVNYKKRLLIISSVVVLLFPYNYEPSGQITVLPIMQEQISTDIAGIIDQVNFEGGEFVEKGTVIAKLSVSDYVSRKKVLEAQLKERQAYVQQLKSLPTNEQVLVAEERLEAAKIQSEYSEDECGRQRKLYDSGSISLSEFSEVERVCSLDQQRILEAEAELNRVMAGVPVSEIETAETSLAPIQAEIEMYEDKIERSKLRMPFDGKIATLNMKERRGHFLDQGNPIAVAQDDSGFKAILEVPESDIAHIKNGAEVSLRTKAYPEETFKGRVTIIEPDVNKENNQRMLKMIVSFDDKNNMLKPGISGYAKVEGNTLMVWEVLTQSIVRFVTVELWAWIP